MLPYSIRYFLIALLISPPRNCNVDDCRWSVGSWLTTQKQLPADDNLTMGRISGLVYTVPFSPGIIFFLGGGFGV